MNMPQSRCRKPAGFLLRKELRRQWKIWRAQAIARFSRHRSEDPVFIIGCGRSGTTILAQALAQHPQVAWLDEPRDAWAAAFPCTDVWTVAAPLRQGRLRLTADDADARGAGRIRRCFGYEQHHHYSAPNRPRLGVFICGFPKPRGFPGHFACASRSARGRHDRPGSPLFRPIFSRNLRQLLRRGKRRRRFPSMVCACADGNGWLAGLLFQIARANPRGQPQHQPLGGNGS